MFRKEKEIKEEPPMKQENQQILTRGRVREINKNKKRNTWLNTAIVIVAILLAITIYLVLNF